MTEMCFKILNQKICFIFFFTKWPTYSYFDMFPFVGIYSTRLRKEFIISDGFLIEYVWVLEVFSHKKDYFNKHLRGHNK